MVELIHIVNVSVDSYIEDAHGSFDWTDPSDEVFGFITELMRSVGTHLYGRRLYETMAVWETDPALAAESELSADFADAWKAADKVVYSTTLPAVTTADTRIERRFDADAVRAMKATATKNLFIGGATITAHAFDAGLVDECHLFVHPVVVGDGKAAFLGGGRLDLELQEERRFDNGVVYLDYRSRTRNPRVEGAPASDQTQD